MHEHYRVKREIERATERERERERIWKKIQWWSTISQRDQQAYLLSNGPSVGREVKKKKKSRRENAAPATDRKQKDLIFNLYLSSDRIAAYLESHRLFSQNSDVSTGELKQETTVTLQPETEHYHLQKCFRWMFCPQCWSELVRLQIRSPSVFLYSTVRLCGQEFAPQPVLLSLTPRLPLVYLSACFVFMLSSAWGNKHQLFGLYARGWLNILLMFHVQVVGDIAYLVNILMACQ